MFTKQQRTRTECARAAREGKGPIVYEGNVYEELSGENAFDINTKYACCGSAREIILLDMASTELIKKYNDCFKKEVDEDALTQPQDEDEYTVDSSQRLAESADGFSFDLGNPVTAFTRVVNYVASCFSLGYSSSIYEQEIAKKVMDLNGEKAITLDNLVKHKLGLCRHQALFVGYLLTQLLHQTYPRSGIAVYRYRTNLKKNDAPQLTPHAVTIVQTEENQLYLLDSTRRQKGGGGIVVDLSNVDLSKPDSEPYKFLCSCYEGYDINDLVQNIVARYQAPDSNHTP